MVMTRKDFIRQAKVLASVRSSSVRNRLINENIRIFKLANPRFDAKRFKAFVEAERKKR